MTAIHFDTDDEARDLVAALDAQGYSTSLTRQGFAGEDDSEDRGWLLVVEPFDERVATMVDLHGGWLLGEDRQVVEPAELPRGPKRWKG